MATVYIGSARGDENGRAHSGKAGDQNGGKEVSTQAWYKHKKGWRVFRAKDPNKAKKIAEAMRVICADDNVGYDQYQRNTLYNLLSENGFNIHNISKNVETDCSALVRVCCKYAGIDLPVFSTSNEAKVLLNSGEFVELKGSKYTDQSIYLGEGDILNTCTKGHTVVVISNGSKYEVLVNTEDYALGERTLENGMEGPDVKTLQSFLIDLDYDCGKWGADGDFGDSTEIALRKFQDDHDLNVDGIYGPKTHAAMLKEIEKSESASNKVEIRGGNCWVRTAPNTSGTRLGVVKAGEVLPYGGQTASNGWHLVEYHNQNGWVSGRYGKLVDQ